LLHIICTHMNLITDYLKELELSDNEVKIYMGLLRLQTTTIKELSQYVGMNRTTAHMYVETLIEKGLIMETRNGSRRQILAEFPEKLKYIVDQKIEGVKNLKKKLPTVLKMMTIKFPKIKEAEEIKVKYYKGRKRIKSIYKDVLQSKEVRAYVTAKLDALFPENIPLFIKTINENKKLHIWEIVDNSAIHKEYIEKMSKSSRYYYKIVPPHIDLSIVDYMIYDNKVALISNKDETIGVVIESVDYYDNAKAIFNLLWDVLSF
jgi:sugar-specific transcriptional regulator TrmB